MAFRSPPKARWWSPCPGAPAGDNLARALEKHRAWIEAKVAERQAAWGHIKAGEAYFLGEAFRLTVLRGQRELSP